MERFDGRTAFITGGEEMSRLATGMSIDAGGEAGARKAKELLFTSDFFSADEAHRLGMVNHVVPADELADFTLELAARIAEKQLFALKLAKEAVNAAQDMQGRKNSLLLGFAYHHLSHAHNQEVHGTPADPTFMQRWKRA